MEDEILKPNPATWTAPVKNFNWLFGYIETPEEVLSLVKKSSIAFYIVAVVQTMVAYFLESSIIIDGVVIVVCAFLLYKFNNRIMAIILLLLSVGSIFATVMNKFGVASGGINMVLAIFLVWVSIRSVQATFRLHEIEKMLLEEPSASA